MGANFHDLLRLSSRAFITSSSDLAGTRQQQLNQHFLGTLISEFQPEGFFQRTTLLAVDLHRFLRQVSGIFVEKFATFATWVSSR